MQIHFVLFTKHDKSLYFVARDTDHWSLYQVNRNETTKVVNTPVRIMAGIYHGNDTDVLALGSFAGELYFTVIDQAARQLWKLAPDNTPSQVGPLGEAITAPAQWIVAGERLFLIGYDHLEGFSLLGCDGKTIASITSFGWNQPGSLTTVQDTLFFATRDGLWTSDGTASGTRIVKDISPGVTSSLIPNLKALPGGVIFSTTTAPDQASLWLTDGTAEGTENLADLSTGDGSPIRLHQFHRFMGRSLYFLASV